MAGVFLPKILTQQPQGIVDIDWSNPLTRGLVFCQLGDEPRDMCTGIYRTSGSGTPNKATNREGKLRSYATSADFYSGNLKADIATSLGMFCIANATTIGANAAFVSHTSDLTTGRGFSAFQASGTTLNFFSGNNDTAISANLTIVEVTSAGICTLGGGVSSAGVCNAYFNGRQTVNSSGHAAPQVGTGLVKVASSRDVVALTTQTNLTLMWDRLPSASEYAILHSNPWQIFKAPSDAYLFTNSTVPSFASISTSGIVSADSVSIQNSNAVVTSSSTVSANSAAIKNSDSSVSSNSIVLADSVAIKNSDSTVTSSSTVLADSIAIQNSNAVVSSNSTVLSDSVAIKNSDSTIMSSTLLSADSIKIAYSDSSISSNLSSSIESQRIQYSESAITSSSNLDVDIYKLEFRSSDVQSSTSLIPDDFANVHSDSTVVTGSSTNGVAIKIAYSEAELNSSSTTAVNAINIAYSSVISDVVLSLSTIAIKIAYSNSAITASSSVALNSIRKVYSETAISSITNAVIDARGLSYARATIANNLAVNVNSKAFIFGRARLNATLTSTAQIANQTYITAKSRTDSRVTAVSNKYSYSAVNVSNTSAIIGFGVSSTPFFATCVLSTIASQIAIPLHKGTYYAVTFNPDGNLTSTVTSTPIYLTLNNNGHISQAAAGDKYIVIDDNVMRYLPEGANVYV